MQTPFLDTLKVKGTLTVSKTTGEVLVRQNIVVRQSIFNFLNGIANQTTTSPIHTLQIGTGGTSDSAGLHPIAPSYTQTALNSYLATLATASSNLSEVNNFVTFSASLGQSQFNGYNISEAALFTLSGQMFNYVTFPAINKSSLFGLSFSWNIGF
jgi:hypothetical protein